MSLFLKIFLWFWLATAIVSGAFIIVTWSLGSEPFVNLWRISATETMTVYVNALAQTNERDGMPEVVRFVHQMQEKSGVKAVVFNAQNQEITENVLPNARSLAEKANRSNQIEIETTGEKALVAEKLQTTNGETLILVAELSHPRPLPFFLDSRTRFFRGLALFIVAGLGCYGLARYLTAPLVKLRNAVKSFAGGNLQTRTGKIGKRRDEIGSLARDFDQMAERIELLISGQKRLISDISHELRSPLARLNVALELARTKSNEETKPLFHRIERESVRLNELIGQLLTLSRLENGTENVEKHRLNVTKIVREVVSDADFEASHQQKSVEFTAEGDFFVNGNESLLRSAIENVVRNAVRHTNSSVEVKLKNQSNEVGITVRDFGNGVPESELEKLFQPFYRVSEARERNSGGVGLGLAIAERAVHAHKGKISAENAKDGGLIVKIKL